jgi:RimJ/RimL family protein N-acetyltransferase
MTLTEKIANSTMAGGKLMLRLTRASAEKFVKNESLLIPVSPLTQEHRQHILQHLLSLAAHDRYLRFGYTASDGHIHHYVEGLNFERDEIYGIFNADLKIIAMAHLALMKEANKEFSGEFGVSVSAYARGRGYGARLFERAVLHARNENVYQMYIHALSENAPMIHIARQGGATIERDGAETEAYLRLPQRDIDSQITEFVTDQYAKTNYSIKEDAKRFWSFLAKVQEIRNGVRVTRHQSAE